VSFAVGDKTTLL